MGLFNSGSKSRASVDDMRGAFYRSYGQSPPSIGATVDNAAAMLGVGRVDIDEMVALTATYNLFKGIASINGSAVGLHDIGDAVERVFDAVGFDDAALWDALFSYGINGVGVALNIAQEYLDSGRMASMVRDRLVEEGGVQATAVLPDPGLPETEPAQAAYSAMSSLGMYSVIFGAGSPNDLVDDLYRSVAAFRSSVGGTVFHRIDDTRCWTVYWAEGATAVVVFYLIDGGEDVTPMMQMIDALEALPERWTVGVGKVDARVPRDAHSIIAGGQIVPVGGIDALAAPEVQQDRRRLRAEIEGGGFTAFGSVTYRGTMPGVDERTQLLWIMIDDEVQLYSPIIEGVDEQLPEWLAAHDFGQYELEALPPFGALRRSLPLSVTNEALRAEAIQLCRYADECERSITPESDAL